jgi:hypothetical protein
MASLSRVYCIVRFVCLRVSGAVAPSAPARSRSLPQQCTAIISFGFGSLLQRPCRFVTWIIPVTLLGRGVLRLSVNALAGYPAEDTRSDRTEVRRGQASFMGKEIERGWLMASANRKDGVGLAAMMCLVIEQVRQNITSRLRPRTILQPTPGRQRGNLIVRFLLRRTLVANGTKRTWRRG